ncbi:putative peptidase family-domain-containing protein [Clohesyomyces aquaticus]|uniref:Putative peptidase family-domain-containing protein n=1 Tax=Clohesyomyces aquaticus TaxID=1231657 RepID=A0A1Y1YII0_9PLEO|nr:putative peptidase family-domain-containing protein [Clohesyomyces aquaticus]
MAPISLCSTNISDGETVHQRCLLVTGSCPSSRTRDELISVTTTGVNGIEAFPEQTWPVASGLFKALVMLSPGQNAIKITHLHNNIEHWSLNINVTYIPLLQYPPLHLAIMVAKDSPLLIDCPPHKHGAFSSAHSDLDAAIAKFRMTAYMWQAMTAQDLHSKGLGRRTFRLDEEWAADTVSREFLNAWHDESLEKEGAMRATAKIHIIRSSRTTKEIRDANIAQQNHSASRKNDLFDYFLEAMKEAGGPFTSSAHPIVAGLILDSHYSITQNLILGHAALGCHNPNGVSLGMFGSHLTYSWPRFVEEVASCLTDVKAPGDKVGNDNGECATMWEACTIGQGAHLHEVGHAFGCPHRPGIMERGYAQDWPKNFLPETAFCGHRQTEGVIVSESTPNNARWNLSDALNFRHLPHFRLPSDRIVTPHLRNAGPMAAAEYTDDEELEAVLHISCPAGIARVSFNDVVEQKPSIAEPLTELRYPQEALEARFDRMEPLSLSLLGFNGKEQSIQDVWKLLTVKTFIRIPGSNIRLFKRSVYGDILEKDPNHGVYEWAQLLKEKGQDGSLHRATSIDLRVGCVWDGGVVKYADGHVSHWGPMRSGGRTHHFGGHASAEIDLPPNASIKRVEVNRGGEFSHEMDGVRMTLSNRTSRGELNRNSGGNIIKLEPASHEVIVGFHGKSSRDGFSGVVEFGIITAPKEVGLDGLPPQTFDLPELRNTCGLDESGNNDGNHSDEDDGSNVGSDEEEG